MKQIKVKFIASAYTDMYERSDSINGGTVIKTNFSTAYWWLKSFYDKTSDVKAIIWQKPVATNKINLVVDEIIQDNPDFLCVSLYFWDTDYHNTICSKIKELKPNIKIIAGGPSIKSSDPQQNFQEFPWIDVVIYGEGEVGFREFINHYYKTKTIKSNINTAIRGNNGTYKRFRYEDYPPYCMYEPYKKELKIHIEECKKAVDLTKARVFVSSESNRGCPYKCSFCDWNAGLHHKLSIRDEEVVFKDFNAISDAGGLIFLNDANFGILKRDEKILKRIMEEKLPVRLLYFNKSKREAAIDLQFTWSEYYKSEIIPGFFSKDLTLALQSLKEDTLKAIYRPSIDWATHKKLFQDKFKNFDSKILKFKSEFILDLPFMTLDDYIFTFEQMYNLMPHFVSMDNWVYLPNSPAALEDGYLDKYGLKVKKIPYQREQETNFSIETCEWVKVVRDEKQDFARIYAIFMSSITAESDPKLFKKALDNVDVVIKICENIYKLQQVRNKGIDYNGILSRDGKTFYSYTEYVNKGKKVLKLLNTAPKLPPVE